MNDTAMTAAAPRTKFQQSDSRSIWLESSERDRAEKHNGLRGNEDADRNREPGENQVYVGMLIDHAGATAFLDGLAAPGMARRCTSKCIPCIFELFWDPEVLV